MPLEHRPACWTHEDNTHAGHLYYFAPTNRQPPPYRRQIEVNAIIDIADDGTLAGVDLIDHMPPPPAALPAPDVTGERAPEQDWSGMTTASISAEQYARSTSPGLPPVAGMETTASDLQTLQRVVEVGVLGIDPERLGRLLRDRDCLIAALAEARAAAQGWEAKADERTAEGKAKLAEVKRDRDKWFSEALEQKRLVEEALADAKKAREDERERAAKIAEGQYPIGGINYQSEQMRVWADSRRQTCKDIAAAIRARTDGDEA